MTQPICFGERQAGMLGKPPTLPPINRAETTCLRTAGLGSTWDATRRASTIAPWEWPMMTTGLPSLKLAM